MKKFIIPTILFIALVTVAYLLIGIKNITPAQLPMVHSFTITDEKSFLENMIPHHQEAVDTSKIIVAQAQDADLKQFGGEVIDAQIREITQMKEWLRAWYSVEYSSDSGSGYEPMMGDLSKFKNTEQEKVYVEGMIRHHKGAIEMARKILTLNPREEVKQLAEGIILTQESEVAVLERWLVSKYANIRGDDKVPHDVQVH